MTIINTCGHEGKLSDEPFYLFDGDGLSWVVFCEKCKEELTPVYMRDLLVLAEVED